MTDETSRIVAGLSEAQKAALSRVCATNGGGVRVPVRVGEDGYGIPTQPQYRKLFDLGLIQGKSGSYETVVHTKVGLAVYRQMREAPHAG
jgi:hypothetical protein